MSLAPFSESAPQYAAIGLRPVPVGYDKRPALRNWQRLGTSSYERLMDRFAGYNVGALNGKRPLPISVVDIDDPAERDWCRERFGDTPVKVRTPSGGEHWYYEGAVQRRIRVDGHKVDVLGQGGFGVLPPSHTPDGAYEFITGSPEEFRHLPRLRLDKAPEQARGMREGDGRNKALFDALRGVAGGVDSYDELLVRACLMNDEYAEPMEHGEVKKIAGNVWRYKSEGRLMLPGCEAQVVVSGAVFEACLANPDALALYGQLKRYHGASKGRPFQLPNATAELLGWRRERFRRARDYLFGVGLLEPVQLGEQGKRKPTVVRFP